MNEKNLSKYAVLKHVELHVKKNNISKTDKMTVVLLLMKYCINTV